MMGWYNDSVGWGGWLAMSVVMVLFWGLVVFGVVAIFRGTSGNTGHSDATAARTPLQTLDERFARGEIDADEYNARQAVLRGAVH